VKKWLKDNVQGLGALSCGLLLFLALGPILHAVDPGAGVVDLGALHVVLFAGVKLLFAVTLAWLIINIEFKFLDHYMDNNVLEDDWRELNGQMRATILVAVFIGLVLAFALLCG
jgi:hypothetical protein